MALSPGENEASGAGFAQTRLYDLACAAPLAVFYGFACGGNVILISRQWPHLHDWDTKLTIANEAVTLVFFGLQIALCLFRRLPVKKSDGLWPRLTAVLGANFGLLLLRLPRAPLSGAWAMTSAALAIGGTLAAIVILSVLGRAFSILPEARQFVVRGPYRIVRHPLYLAEIAATLGIMLQFRQPWAALIAAATIGLQIRRIGYEEDVLRQTFAGYDDYARRTSRLIPGVY